MAQNMAHKITPKIETATVIGAGTMGAAIAGHLANAGLTVHLLDIVPTSLTAEEAAAGLTLNNTAVRNRIVNAGFARMVKARPSNLFGPDIAQRIHLGNLEDDLAAAVGASDWVIEAIVEQLAPKQGLMTRLEPLLPTHAIVSTNTSGIPIAQIGAGRSAHFGARFLGTHFFNPPRYLPLVEIIPTAATQPSIVQIVRAFVEEQLGKNVVICHDTPNFIANRMISYIMADLIAFATDNGYSVEEVDALTGPLLGHPRSATFRLNDVVGIDVWAMIARNLHPLIPHDDQRDVLLAPAYLHVLQTLIDHGHLGSKSGQGFYQTHTSPDGEKSFWGLVLEEAKGGQVRYTPPQNPNWPDVETVARQPLPQRLRALVTLPGRVGALLWHTLSHTLAYAAARVPEIADSPLDIDRAMEWGFAWELGPFALWDALGVSDTVARMRDEGTPVAPWVEKMLAEGHTHFYRQQGEMRQTYAPAAGAYSDIALDSRHIRVAALRARTGALASNEAASLLSLGDGVLLLEFHSKMNALDSTLFPILTHALDALHGGATGLVIGNDGAHFSVGANLRAMLAAAEAEDWRAIDKLIAEGQHLFLALRAAPKPVIATPFQRVLGGGAEICLAAHAVVAHAETTIGLVEFNVGLIPGWGGCKEMVRRHVRADAPLVGLRHILTLLTGAKSSASAHEAKTLGLLAPTDQVIMHRDYLLHAARQRVLELAQSFMPPTTVNNVYAAGPETMALLNRETDAAADAGTLLAHDVVIARAAIHVLCGGDEAGWHNEERFLGLERQHFLQLIRTSATQTRIRHVLATGKPLRN